MALVGKKCIATWVTGRDCLSNKGVASDENKKMGGVNF